MLLDVRNLVVEIGSGVRALRPVDGVSFSIGEGEVLALVGESGCGKSMTASALIRLLPAGGTAPEGSAVMDGVDLLRLPEYSMRGVRGSLVSQIFQEPATSLNPVMTVGEQIAEVLVVHGADRAGARAEALSWMKKVGIPQPEQRFGSFPHELSGGQKQRIVIAMALAAHPRLVIADEPTTALDVTTQAQILDLLRGLQKTEGLSVLLITHDLAVVRQMADRVALMYAGRIVEEAPVAEFFAHPAHPYAKSLLAAVPDSSRRGAPLEGIPGTVPALSDMPQGCRFAPRCPLAQPCCCRRPDFSRVGEGHAACWRLGVPRPVQAGKPLPAAAAPGKVLLELKDYRVWFPVRRGLLRRTVGFVKAVDGVSLAIAAGRTLALVGESGSGKTTVGKALLQLLRGKAQIHGVARFGGEDLASLRGSALKRMRERIQVVFQDPFSSLDPRMTVGEILAEGVESLCPQLARAQRQARVKALLRQVGLSGDAAQRFPHEFSGGQRQRIAIARALSVEPELIVCDEPTSALDVSVQAQILNLLKDLQRSTGVAYLFITHNFGVVEYLADDVAVMQAGHLVEAGPADQVLAHPQHPYTRRLLAAVPRL